MKRLRKIPKSIMDEASAYVCNHARYHPESPTKPYAVRHHMRPSEAFIAADTWELTEQVARFLTDRAATQAKGERR